MAGDIEVSFGAITCFYYFSEIFKWVFSARKMNLRTHKATYHAAKKTVSFYHIVQLFAVLFPIRLVYRTIERFGLRVAF